MRRCFCIALDDTAPDNDFRCLRLSGIKWTDAIVFQSVCEMAHHLWGATEDLDCKMNADAYYALLVFMNKMLSETNVQVTLTVDEKIGAKEGYAFWALEWT